MDASTPKRSTKRPRLDSSLLLSPVLDSSIFYPSLIESSLADSTTAIEVVDKSASSFAVEEDVAADTTSSLKKSEVSSGDESGVIYLPSETDSSISSVQSPPDPTTPREHELLKIAPVLISSCCTRECLLNLTALDVLKIREKFKSIDTIQQKQWITDRLNENSHAIKDSVLETKFIIAGQEVCKVAWCKVLQVSTKHVSKILKSISQGQVSS